VSDTPQLLLAHHLKALKLPTFLREYDKLAQQCAADGVDHPRYLLRLAELELIERERRMVERRIKEARFPTVKSLDSFDFTVIPSLNKTLVLELARCEYIARRENIIAVGNSAPAKRISRSDWGWRPARRAYRSASSQPPPWSTN
jgi:DNA replication protein DnaC